MSVVTLTYPSQSSEKASFSFPTIPCGTDICVDILFLLSLRIDSQGILLTIAQASQMLLSNCFPKLFVHLVFNLALSEFICLIVL